LGPILFLCYINDFWRATTLFSVLFADDTTCLAKGKNLQNLTQYVNIELKKIANWFLANKMAVNAGKTKYMIFRTQGKRIDPNECNVVFNSNELGKEEDPALISPIERVYNEGATTNFKLLGVLFDEYLAVDQHISHLCNKISKSLYCINRVKNFINKDALTLLYYAMVHSHLVYCINVYGCSTKTNLNKLVLKQKEAIRIISNAGFREHTEPLFKKLKILPFEQLCKYSVLKFMHNFSNRKLPFSFADTWIWNRDRNIDRPLRNADDLYIPAHNFATLKRMQLFNFPKLWNDHPISKNNPSLHSFLKTIKFEMLSALTD